MGEVKRFVWIGSALLLVSTIFSGCINISEQIKLKLNGSGKAKITWAYPLRFSSTLQKREQNLLPANKNEVKKLFPAHQRLIFSEISSQKSKTMSSITAELKFKRIEDLNHGGLSFSLQQKEDLWEFTIKIEGKEHPPPKPKTRDKASAEVMDKILESFGITVVVELPGVVEETNGETLEAKKVRWKVPLKKLLELKKGEMLVLRATFSPGFWDRLKSFF